MNNQQKTKEIREKVANATMDRIGLGLSSKPSIENKAVMMLVYELNNLAAVFSPLLGLDKHIEVIRAICDGMELVKSETDKLEG